jgi:FtsX-like permease family protein
VLGSFTGRRMRSAWLLVGCVAATVLVTSALVSALVSFYVTALPAAVTSELAKAGGMSIELDGDAGAGVSRPTAAVIARLSDALRTVPFRMYEATWSDDLAVPQSHESGPVLAIQAAVVGAIAANAELVSGRWPAAPRAGGPIGAALAVTAARDLGLSVGSLLSLRDLTTGGQVRLQISGLYRPRQGSAPYWQLDVIGPSGVAVTSGFISYGPAVVAAAAFGGPASGLLTASQLSIVALPRVGSVRPTELTALAGRISRAAGEIDNSGQLTVNTEMPQLLTNASAGLATARSLILIGGLQLLLLAGAALALASRLLASYREEETAIRAARGAARGQLIRLSLVEAALGTAISAAVGVIAGGYLSAVLQAHLTGLAQPALVHGWIVWVPAAALAVLALSFVMWPTIRPPRPGDARIRRGRAAPVAVAIAAGADVALIVLAVLAVRELRTYSAAAQIASGSGIDPVVAVAPALALAGLAIVPLRLLPVVARGLERLTARGTRFGSAMANWELSRRPLRQSGPALLVILAVGASTLALAQYESWRQSLKDQAAFATGADVSVQPPQSGPTAHTYRIGALPGVTAAMPVSAVPLESSGPLLVIDAALAARTVTLRPDLSSRPVQQLFGTITTRARRGLLLPGHPARLAITASLTSGLGPVSATLTVQDAQGVTFSVQTTAMPADGAPHTLTARLDPGASYPLRLIGVAVDYAMAAYPLSPQAERGDESAVLRLDAISVGKGEAGQFSPIAAGRALGAWPAQAAGAGLSTVLSGLGGATDGATTPAIRSAAAAGAAYQVAFTPGHGPLVPHPARGASRTPQPGQGEIDVDIPAARRAVPVIATTGYAARNGLRTGAVFAVPIAGDQISCELVAGYRCCSASSAWTCT